MLKTVSMSKNLMSGAGAVRAVLLAPIAFAQKDDPAQSADAVVDELLADGTLEDDGAKHAASERTEPSENWFGCKPDDEAAQQSCDSDQPSPTGPQQWRRALERGRSAADAA